MRLIPLTKGKSAIIDSEDYKRISRFHWCISTSSKYEYAIRNVYKNGKRIAIVRMHRVIFNVPDGLMVDHINGNTLDNRKKNLRIATRSENMWNRRKTKLNKTGYKGVRMKEKSKKYEATIAVNKKWLHLGYFNTPQEAARAYNSAAQKYHGQFARLNDL